MLALLLIDALICGAVGAMITSARGAGALIGALVGAVFGPLGVIASFAFSGQSGGNGGAANATPAASSADVSFRDCPFCAEPIRKAAIKCRYCGSDVEPVIDAPENVLAEGTASAPLHDMAPALQPDAKQGDRVILMLGLALVLLLAFLWIAGASF